MSAPPALLNEGGLALGSAAFIAADVLPLACLCAYWRGLWCSIWRFSSSLVPI
jgi:hypothetical protein